MRRPSSALDINAHKDDNWGEYILEGTHQLSDRAVHIKDRLQQPGDCNLGWFVYDDELVWSPATHAQFPRVRPRHTLAERKLASLSL